MKNAVKFIITLVITMSIYVGCVIWITDGVVLTAYHKVLICMVGSLPLITVFMLADIRDWI